MKNAIRVMVGVLIGLVIGVIIGFDDGVRSPKKPPSLQTSEFQVRDTGDDFLKELCERRGVDFDGEWVYCCPRCVKGGAMIQRGLTGSVYYGFLCTYPELEELKPGETVDVNTSHSQTYCNKCRYPEGTDWIIYQIEEAETSYLTIENCIFTDIDPNKPIKIL